MLEKDICIRFVKILKEIQHLSTKPFVWFHVVNEFDKRRNTYSHNFNLAKMGRVSGVADYIFLWDNGNLALEFKVPKGKQNEAQKLFELKCIKCGIPYRIAHSVEEAYAILEGVGLFEKGKIIL